MRLHCYFVIELKTGEFKPEYAGKLNFYLAAVDGIMKTDRDDPTIGLLLCESQDEAVVEYSFKNLQSPIGVSTYTVTRELPTALEEEVPSVQDLNSPWCKWLNSRRADICLLYTSLVTGTIDLTQ